jgi:beta-lactamase class A
MTHSPQRRALLFAVATVPWILAGTAQADTQSSSASAQALLATLERTAGGRLGVSACNTANAMRIGYRADERFPFCSTFKLMLTAAILARSTQVAGLMQQRLHYSRRNLINYSPVSAKHLADGMTIAELCAAAMQYSDNTAANLLLKVLGGPAALTAFARSIGDPEFRLDRRETELNTAIPGDPRDTSTPAAMARSLQVLALGQILPAPQRDQLQQWLRGNTTGAKRIAAALPADWRSGDKTGTGGYGATNDIAVLWPPTREPIVLAIYYTQKKEDAEARDDVVAAAAKIVVGAMG